MSVNKFGKLLIILGKVFLWCINVIEVIFWYIFLLRIDLRIINVILKYVVWK